MVSPILLSKFIVDSQEMKMVDSFPFLSSNRDKNALDKKAGINSTEESNNKHSQDYEGCFFKVIIEQWFFSTVIVHGHEIWTLKRAKGR